MAQAENAITNQKSFAFDLRSRLGDSLKNARLKAGVTVDAVAHETKISKQFIIYLESGHFEHLPGQVFGRGFIKNIARYLRSDVTELLKLYDDCWGDGKVQSQMITENRSVAMSEQMQTKAPMADAEARDTAVPAQRIRTSDIPDIKHLPSVEARRVFKVPAWLARSILSQNTWLTVLSTVAAVMVIGVLGRWVVARVNKAPLAQIASPVAVQDSQNSIETTHDGEKASADITELLNSTNSPANGEAAIPSNMVEKVIDTNQTAIDTTGSKTPAAALPKSESVGATSANKASISISEDSPLSVEGSPVAFEQVLQLNVTSPVEIRMIIDGKKSDRVIYPVGTVQFTFRERAELFIYEASAVELTFNGKSLGSLGNKGRKRKIFFQAKPSESDFPN